jgi:multiple sugar transport system substrate-binding protein
MMASNTAPDICQFTPDEFPDYAARGALRSLEPHIKADKVFKADDYWEPLIKAYQWKGQQGAVPIYNSTYVLFYNKTMFEKAGVKFPDDTWTWHEHVIEAGKAITKEGQFGFGFGTGTGVTSGKFWGDGAEIFDAEYTKSLFDSPEAIKAIQEYADLRNVHKIAPSPAQAGDMNNDTLFSTGRIAMYLVGQWVMNNLISTKSKDWEVDVALQPKGRQRRMCRLGGGGYTLTLDSKSPEQAWKLLSWMGGTEVQTSWAKAGLQPPALKKIALSQDYLSIRPPEHIQIFLDQTNFSRTMYPGLPGNAEWNNIVNTQLDPIWLGQAKAADVMPKIKADLDKWLKDLKRDEWKPLV